MPESFVNTDKEKSLKVPLGCDSLVSFIKRFDPSNNESTDDLSPSKQVAKGVAYLERKCSVKYGFQCKFGLSRDLTKCTEIPVEIFSSGLIYDVIKDLDVSPIILTSIAQFIQQTRDPETKTYNFFVDRRIMADDADSTTVSLWTLLNHPGAICDEEVLESVAVVLGNKTPSGIIETFFPPFSNQRGKLDCVTLSNVLRLVYFMGLSDEDELGPSEDFIERFLRDDECGYENGLFYYDTPDPLLYFLSNALEHNERAERRFTPLIKERLLKRLGANRYPLDIAWRVLTAVRLNMLEDEDVKETVRREVEILCEMQAADGSWPRDSIYRYKGWYFGSKSISTAFALKAIKLFSEAVQGEQ